MPTIQNLYGIPLINPAGFLSASSLTTVALNASNVAFGTIFQAENIAVHGAIVGLRGLSCSAITSPPTYRASLQGVSSRGTPDGTVKGGGSPASVTFTPTTGYLSQTFANSYTPSSGDVLAAVIEYSSGTIGGSNTATFNRSVTTVLSNSGAYAILQTAGTWAVGSGSTLLAPVYADGYVGRGIVCARAVSNNVAASTSYGNAFTPSQSMYFSGAYMAFRAPASSAALTVTLYEGSSTSLGSLTAVSTSATFSPDLSWSATSVVIAGQITMPPYTLQPNTMYRLMLSNSGTALTTFPSATFNSQEELQSCFGPLTGCSAAAGTVTDYASGTDWRGFMVVPCVDYFSASSGGILVNPALLGV